MLRRRSLLLTAAWLSLGPLNSAAQRLQEMDEAERSALREFLQRTVATDSSFEDRFDAEVWLTDMAQRLKPFVGDPPDRLLLLRQVHGAATRSELSPELVLAVIEVESAFDRFAISRAGAQGLMQVMPFWRAEIGREEDNLTDNATNLDYGCRILQFYLRRERGHLRRALAAYNGSAGQDWYPQRVFNAWQARWRDEPLPW